ncbi:hypothetical protein [Alteraurantiacibacter aquimixticola]|uniref:MarR family transcriptional regulator n=1 Tax=Alteraurantiacibacter aquimixticola TaxID=2489173 RepID=A0A4T3F2D1_9SPHN|nr:hypothetical protein [Alteraurantiacibacter aquimixticola]TIX50230.1 hypothetical protein E5222_08055 [Alteraurantiacibacter aquimixticola]
MAEIPVPHGSEFSQLQSLVDRVQQIERRISHLPQSNKQSQPTDIDLASIASAIYRARRRRSRFLPEALFAEPAWDMLLELFVTQAFGRQVSVSSICLAADVPQTTGLRYLEILEKVRFVERRYMPGDRRVKMVSLTQLGYKVMRAYLMDGIGNAEVPLPA